MSYSFLEDYRPINDSDLFGIDPAADAVDKIMEFLDIYVIPGIGKKLMRILKNLISGTSKMNNYICGLVTDYIPPRLGYEELDMSELVFRVFVYMDDKNKSFVSSLLLSFNVVCPLFGPTVVCGDFKKTLEYENIVDNANEIVSIILTKRGTMKKNLKRLME